MNAVSPPPAGWYPDPSGRAPFRYWDGARWTEHTDQGTAPAPSPTAPMAPSAPLAPSAPAAPTAPMYTPAAPGYQPAAPAYTAPAPMGGAAPAGGNWTAQSFLDDLKKLDGLALVVVGALIFILSSFLTWTSGTVSASDPNTGQRLSESSSANGWEDDNAWVIRGFDVDDLLNRTTVEAPDSGNDMVIMLPIALVAAGIAVASRTGKKVKNHAEIVVGASGVLAVLMIAEAVTVSGAIDDVASAAALIGQSVDAGLAYGFYLAIVATLVMAGGAVKHYLADKQAKA